MSQIITPNGHIIGLKYATPPVSKYFTLINDDPGKHWS
jgi:hypothetical protein